MKPAPTTRWQRLFSALRNDEGATAAEFALVLPVFLLMVFGSIYSCMLVGAIVELHQVTEAAARCLSVNTVSACTSANISSYGSGLYSGPKITGLNFVANTPASGCGNQVVGAGDFTLFTGVGKVTAHLSSTACYPII